MTFRAAETTCRSQVSSAQTAAADQKLKQKLVVNLPRMGEEELKSISSKGSSQQPRTSTAVEGARPQLAGTEPMEVDTAEVSATSRSSRVGAAARPKNKGASASQARAQSTGRINARARRLSSMPLTNRAFTLWSRMLWNVMV